MAPSGLDGPDEHPRACRAAQEQQCSRTPHSPVAHVATRIIVRQDGRRQTRKCWPCVCGLWKNSIRRTSRRRRQRAQREGSNRRSPPTVKPEALVSQKMMRPARAGPPVTQPQPPLRPWLPQQPNLMQVKPKPDAAAGERASVTPPSALAAFASKPKPNLKSMLSKSAGLAHSPPRSTVFILKGGQGVPLAQGSDRQRHAGRLVERDGGLFEQAAVRTRTRSAGTIITRSSRRCTRRWLTSTTRRRRTNLY